jgi:hypothetical protein
MESAGWNDVPAENGLIAMAMGYKNTHYKGEKTKEKTEES